MLAYSYLSAAIGFALAITIASMATIYENNNVTTNPATTTMPIGKVMLAAKKLRDYSTTK